MTGDRTNELTVIDENKIDAETALSVLVTGNIQALTPENKLKYYNGLCKSLKLNPLTQPFEYIKLNGKERLYAKKDATDQLRKANNVSIKIKERSAMNDIYIVIATAELPDGRTDESIGSVTIKGLSGDALANSIMKCETKAKRRVTLSICGLGMLDETEIETIPGTNNGNKKAASSVMPVSPSVAETNNNTNGKDDKITEKQIKRLFAIAYSNDVNNERIANYIENKFHKADVSELTKIEYDLLIEKIESLKKATEPQQEGDFFNDERMVK